MNRGGFDIASFLMDSIRGQPKQATYHYQDLSPLTKHTETVENHVFRVHLPDFRAEDIRVQIDDNSKKLLVRCRKPLAQTTVARVELDLDVPKDADIGHIKGNFEQGWLSLSMPKKRITQNPDKKDEEEIPKEKAGSGERKKEEKLIPKEKAEREKRKKKEEPLPKEEQKKSKEEDTSKQTDLPKEKIEKDKTEEKTKAESEKRKKKEEEPLPKEEQKKSKEEDTSKETDSPKEKIEKDKTEEKTKAESSKEGSLPEDKPTADADSREQERKKQLDKAKSKKDTTEEAPSNSMHEEKAKACRKRQRREGKWEGGNNWRGKIEAMEEWLDGGLVVKLMESFENNKKLIYAAAVGFSVGFLVSRTLCSRRT